MPAALSLMLIYISVMALAQFIGLIAPVNILVALVVPRETGSRTQRLRRPVINGSLLYHFQLNAIHTTISPHNATKRTPCLSSLVCSVLLEVWCKKNRADILGLPLTLLSFLFCFLNSGCSQFRQGPRIDCHEAFPEEGLGQ